MTDRADEIARMLNAVPKYVASTTLQSGPWSETTVITDVAGQVGELKAVPGKDIVVMGSSELAQSLMRHELVDQYRLMLHPIVLGSGKRLLREGGPASALELIEAATSTSGLVILTYEPAWR